MPKKVFSIWLDSHSRIAVSFFRRRKEILSFVVKLEVRRNGHWIEVQRYDTHHDCVHKDVLSRDGEKPISGGGNMAIKARKLTADDVEAYIRSLGGVEVTAEEKKTPEWREECRSFLRIMAHDDTSIPAPNEEEELDKECGPAILD
jgi:hypothetical protein